MHNPGGGKSEVTACMGEVSRMKTYMPAQDKVVYRFLAGETSPVAAHFPTVFH